MKGDIVAVQALITAGADVNIAGYSVRDVLRKQTPLHLACWFRYLDIGDAIVKLLVQSGAQVTARNHFGETPLHLACFENPLKEKPDMIGSDYENSKAHRLQRQDDRLCSSRIVAFLLTQKGVDAQCENFAKHWPANECRKYEDICQWPLAMRWLVSDCNPSLITPLHYLCYAANVRSIPLLMDYGKTKR
jgi:ankyrin repeat protein